MFTITITDHQRDVIAELLFEEIQANKAYLRDEILDDDERLDVVERLNELQALYFDLGGV